MTALYVVIGFAFGIIVGMCFESASHADHIETRLDAEIRSLNAHRERIKQNRQ